MNTNTFYRGIAALVASAALAGCTAVKHETAIKPNKHYTIHQATEGCCPVVTKGGLHVRVEEHLGNADVETAPGSGQRPFKIFSDRDSDGRIDEYVQSRISRVSNQDPLRMCQNWLLEQVPFVFDYLQGNSDRLPYIVPMPVDAREDYRAAQKLFNAQLNKPSGRRNTGD
jgi:hypothetical protein